MKQAAYRAKKYKAAKIAKRCPRCDERVDTETTYCEECLKIKKVEYLRKTYGIGDEEARAYVAWQETRRQAKEKRESRKNQDGHFIACCGRWQPITILPHICQTCQQVYLKEAA
jgi:late competence protein required for DNA uptake (superfamily II DNA/RNA helicase)